MKLDFFIGGAPKSATSTIYDILKNHPEISVPHVKETHFYSYPEVADTYYDVNIVKTETEFFRLFSKEKKGIKGDFSPSYLFRSESFQRLKKNNANIKAIFILREPIARMKSHYLMDKALGYNRLDLNEKLLSSSKFYNEYVGNSLYYENIYKAFSSFGKDNVLVLFFENFILNQEESIRSITDFLNISPLLKLPKTVESNKGRTDNLQLMFLLRNIGILEPLKKITPSFIKYFFKKVLFSTKPKTTINNNIFLKYFSQDVENLAVIFPEIKTIWKLHFNKCDNDIERT